MDVYSPRDFIPWGYMLSDTPNDPLLLIHSVDLNPHGALPTFGGRCDNCITLADTGPFSQTLTCDHNRTLAYQVICRGVVPIPDFHFQSNCIAVSYEYPQVVIVINKTGIAILLR